MNDKEACIALSFGRLEIPHHLFKDCVMQDAAEQVRKIALKALEKQIPKKPKRHEWNGINGKPYELCPNCETNLCCEMPYDKKPKYCKECGQRLDWSKT